MFNHTQINTGDTNINVNAISGTLVKNYQKSFVMRFQKGSKLENSIFSEDPHIMLNEYPWRGKSVVVIQAMILAENHYLCELMYKEDFENMFNNAKC